MPIANYTTSVGADRTVQEIQSILVKHGARQMLLDYDANGQIMSLSFIVDTPYGAIPFRLPANALAVQKVLEQDRVGQRYLTYEHCVKVTWRILKDWVRAQMALLETEMVTVEQIFLPYMVVDEKSTLYEKMIDSKFLLSGGK